jgi:hypothetical protein
MGDARPLCVGFLPRQALPLNLEAASGPRPALAGARAGGGERLRIVVLSSSMSSNGNARLHRAEKNEQAFKAHNERRAAAEEAGEVPEDEPVPFVCECDNPSCTKAIEVPLGEYERAVEPVDRFLVAPGHEDPAVEVVVEEHDNYIIVSKPDLKRRAS